MHAVRETKKKLSRCHSNELFWLLVFYYVFFISYCTPYTAS